MIGIRSQQAALEIARLTRWSGERRMARTLFGIAIAGGIVLLFAPWRQNAVGTGQVIAYSPNERPLDVQAPIEGRVARWHFQEGDQVEEGEIIVELQDNDPRVIARYETQQSAMDERLAAAAASVAALEQRLAALGGLRERALAAADARVRVAVNGREAALRDLEAALAKHRAASLQLRRVEALAADGLDSRRDLELAQRNETQADAAVAAARAGVEAAKSEVTAKLAERDGKAAEIDAEIAGTRNALEAARADWSSARADLAAAERALARQRSLDIRAPRTGMLTHVQARERSAYVKQGQKLATVVPDAGHRAVELFITGNDAPLVVAGQPVRLQFEGWPAIQFGGWPKAAVGTFPGEVAFVDAHATAQGRFRVVVRPSDGEDWPNARVLRQGNAVNGWILLNRVALGYELWRQLNGFPADLPSRAAEASGYGGK